MCGAGGQLRPLPTLHSSPYLSVDLMCPPPTKLLHPPRRVPGPLPASAANEGPCPHRTNLVLGQTNQG